MWGEGGITGMERVKILKSMVHKIINITMLENVKKSQISHIFLFFKCFLWDSKHLG